MASNASATTVTSVTSVTALFNLRDGVQRVVPEAQGISVTAGPACERARRTARPTHRIRPITQVALPLLRPELCSSPRICDLIACAVECLDAPETTHHACKTLRKLLQHASGRECPPAPAPQTSSYEI